MKLTIEDEKYLRNQRYVTNGTIIFVIFFILYIHIKFDDISMTLGLFLMWCMGFWFLKLFDRKDKKKLIEYRKIKK